MRVEGPIPRTITRVHVIEASIGNTKHQLMEAVEVAPTAPINRASGWERENLLGALAYAVADRRLEGVTNVLWTVEGY